ncbi:MAG: FAD-binding oxidoreductase, partial [Planctomycetota bacterium]|nr:FAD-binding oxidoreductase [Planctomycetota bacterium]
MTESTYQLPIVQTLEPTTVAELAGFVQQAHDQSTPVYPLGGQTGIHYGLPAKNDGWGISTTQLNKIIDFPVKDLTITVETGITMQVLNETLAKEGLMLPLDVPQEAAATLGGVIATNTNGPRRFGYGTVRDFVIGIEAVNGKGQIFHGGGRVVKNVAGYDFCKLLTGSLGTLGVITQATVKLKPLPEASATVVVSLENPEVAEACVAMLLESPTVPSAIELLCGEAWAELTGNSKDRMTLAVQLTGMAVETAWSQQRLVEDLKLHGAPGASVLSMDAHTQLWQQIQEFPAEQRELTVQVKTVSSGVVPVIKKCRALSPDCTIQAHAGNGVVTVGFDELPEGGISDVVITELGPLATTYHGHVETLRCPNPEDLTMSTMWGQLSAPEWLHDRIKKQFDPRLILNPGRFVYQ